MKANEFIKKYGIAEAKALVNAQSWTMRQIALSTIVDTKELTKLVESHELIESYGGLDAARKEAHKNCFDFNAPLLKAIADVESCL